MSERGAAADLHDSSQALGEQPTLIASAIPSDTPPDAPVASGARAVQGSDWVGREIAGRYVIRERLGEGGMGVVYVAEHMHLKKRVAFKVIHPELAAHEELLLRFKREALATGQLDHPHIAAAIDFGELADGGAFIVMPLVRGRSLQAELDEVGRFDPRRAARLGAEIADALSAAHSVGIVHRDLKPDNVLLEKRSDGSEAAKVLDFGVASLAGRSEGLSVVARPLTQAGTILGTPGYMSPEQATAGEVDFRTDLYALGVILWELCNGRRLFDGDDITQIFAKQFKSLPPLLELGAAAASRDLSALVARLLAWDKNERPGSAAEVRDALRAIAERRQEPAAFPLPDIATWLAPLRPHWQRVRPLLARLRPFFAHARKRALHKHLYVAAVLLLFVVPLLMRGRKPAAEPMLAPEVPSAVEEPANTPTKSRDEESVKEPPQAPGKLAPLPEVFEKPADTLLNGRNVKERRGVAKRILRSQGVPAYLSLLAELELATRCDDRKEAVAEMRKLQDPRVLPALERLAEQPRTGCAPLRLGDCLACLRRDLDQTIGVLEQARDD